VDEELQTCGLTESIEQLDFWIFSHFLLGHQSHTPVPHSAKKRAGLLYRELDGRLWAEYSTPRDSGSEVLHTHCLLTSKSSFCTLRPQHASSSMLASQIVGSWSQSHKDIFCMGLGGSGRH
jgi:hypothetical protein